VAAGGEERLIAIVLAAGAGTRMGGPKARLVIDGEPLAVLHARRFRDAGCAQVVSVTRRELALWLASWLGPGRIAISEAPDPAGSLAIGLAAFPPHDEDVLVITPVDALPARAATIAALVATVRAGAEAATPVYAGRGGHPIAARARALAGLAAAPRPLRDVLAALGPRRARVEVDDPAVTIDLDTPDDVARVTGAPPRFAE
jgi:CTP:molybdopterin cytidylyltransferase MocA